MTGEQKKKVYDPEERTARFGKEIIKFCNSLPRTPITTPLIVQLVKSGTSIGANYCEADDAESSLDFRNKIGICKKEARETKHFLRMLMTAILDCAPKIPVLLQEAAEIHLIFNSIYKKVSQKLA